MSVALPSLPAIVWLESIPSTNVEAQERFASGETGSLWIAARQQTHGKGRLGREWVSRAGNLYASLLLPVECPVSVLPSLSLVAGLAVRDALMATGVEAALELKWPNDVLLGGRKVSGILIETANHANRLAAIIGCGLNLSHHPVETRWPATHLAEHTINMDPEAMLAQLATTMAQRICQWDNGAGLSHIRDDWMDAAMGRGTKVVLDDGSSGVFDGLHDTGALIVRNEDGTVKHYHAGDVKWVDIRGAGT